MGKSEGNGIFLFDKPEEIRKKVMRAVTDTGPTEPNQEPSEAVKNLFTIMKVVSDPDTVKYFREKHASCEIRYGDLKKQLAEDIIKFTDPIRLRINEILSDNKFLSRVVSDGAEKARASASKTVREVREIIGYRPF
jgi:tryptophanyl-tRNA synthetase